MTLAERLRAIVGVMPEDGAVTLPVRQLRTWLDEEPSGTDLTLEELRDRHFPEMSLSRLREWCQEKKFPNAYKRAGRGWRVPETDVELYKQAERERTFPVPQQQQQETNKLNTPGRTVDLGQWRRHA